MNDSSFGKVISLDSMNNLHEVLDSIMPSLTTEDDKENNDSPVSEPPKVTDLMLPGLLGDITHACCENTEAVPVAVAANLIVRFISHIGRLRYVVIGDDKPWLNNYFLLIGPSGMGKGVSAKAPSRIFSRVQDNLEMKFKHAFDSGNGNGLKEYHQLNIHNGGLSSGEGLGFALDDGEESPVPGRVITDKRLLIIESEMANVLSHISRQGNTLSAQLRNAYEGEDIKPMTKRDRVRVSDPYICIMGNITPEELLTFDENKTQSFNGLLNRFMMLWTQPQKLVYRPTGLTDDQVDYFSKAISDNLLLARNHSFEVHWKKIKGMSTPLNISDEAWEFYGKVYSSLMNVPCSKRISSLVRRHRVHAILMASALALFEGLDVVTKDMMKGALDWVEYSRKTIVYCYNTHNEQIKAEESHKLAKKILYAIILLSKQHGSCTRTDIYNFCQRKLRRTQLNESIEILINWIPPLIEQNSKQLESGRNISVYMPTYDAKCLVK